MVGCWARAASGQTTTVRPTKLINSRRLIAAPEAQDRASYRAQEHSGRAERKACKMSALGQKQTFALHQPMSALPARADMCGATRDVRFGPQADIRTPVFGLLINC